MKKVQEGQRMKLLSLAEVVAKSVNDCSHCNTVEGHGGVRWDGHSQGKVFYALEATK
jgi:hypothetical protein